MKAHQTTIKDIARHLGISPSTVSRALKDHPDISTLTKKKVKELAEKMKYRPNTIALSLKHNRSFTIGVIIPEIVHHFFSSVISGISDVAYSSGYNVMITQSNESYEREVKDTHAMLSNRVDGVLVSVAKESESFDHFRQLERNGVPIVFFDRVAPDITTDKVVVDDIEGAFKAVEYMIQSGCRNIYHFAAPQHLFIGQNRLEGYKRALTRYGIEYDSTKVVKCDTYHEAMVLMQQILDTGAKPDGIFAANDATAIGAMRICKKAGLRIPDDVSVFGFTNGLISSMTDPTLSTVDQHGFEMGRIAAKTLLHRINTDNEFYIPETHVVKTELIFRESTRKL